jgi:2,5-diamino-6-(ribosylamino)-4(3H)-pyrimidinone 5'-phosphate reductase
VRGIEKVKATTLPKVAIYNLSSLDGRLDRVSDSPDAMFLYYELSYSWKADAILMGSETIIVLGGHEPEEAAVEAPDPPQKLPPPGTEDLIYEPRPLLVVPDSRGRIHNWRLLQQEPWWRKIVVLCSEATPTSYLDYLGKRHLEYIIVGDDHVDLRRALEELNARYGVKSVRTDCGGTLNGVLLREGLADEVSVLICPTLVGGRRGTSLFDEGDVESANGFIQLRLTHMERVRGDAIWLRYEVAGRELPLEKT